MRRRLSTALLVAATLVWVVASAAWVRSRFRADLVGVVLPGRVYVEADSHDGRVAVRIVRDWPAPPPVHRSLAPAAFDDFDFGGRDELVGPDEFDSWLFDRPREWAWRDFAVSRSTLWFRTGPDGRPFLNVPQRGWKFWSGPPPPTTDGLPSASARFPTWAVPATATLPVTLWLATAGAGMTSARRRAGAPSAGRLPRRDRGGILPVAMKTSPFPGMDPYLARYWDDVHTRLCAEISTDLNPVLPKGLRARAGQNIWLDTHDEDGPRQRTHPVEGDTVIVATGPAVAVATRRASLSTVEPVVVRPSPPCSGTGGCRSSTRPTATAS